MFFEEELVILEGILGLIIILLFIGRGKRDLGLWVGIYIKEGGIRRGMLVMKLEIKDMIRRMILGGEMVIRIVGIVDYYGLMIIFSSGGFFIRSL